MADLTVRITATENASGVLRKVADAASKAADQLEKAGTEGAQGLDKIEQSAQQTAPAVERVGESAKRAGVDLQAMGAALTAIGAGLAYAGQLAMENERMIVGLQKAYGDAAGEMIAFADTLSAETGNLFNDDDILAGERFFATLRNNYGLTIQEIQEVARITADLAAASGVSYEDAANRVTAALRGEAEAAEYLGLTMNQAAIDREGLTLTMSNQEAAQFRLNALQEQSAVYMGTAAAVAQTSAGQWANLTNSLKDAAQGVGDFIGPYGAMIGGLGTAAVGLSQFAGGFTALASGIRIATAASLAFAVTPVGAAVLAVGAGLALATKAFMDNRAESAATAAEWEAAAVSAQTLAESIESLSLQSWADANWARGLSESVVNEFNWLTEYLDDEVANSRGTGDWFDNLIMDRMSADGIDMSRVDELAQVWGDYANRALEEMIPDGADQDRFNQAMTNLLSLEGVDNINFDAIQSEVDRLFKAFNAADGAISVEKFNSQLESLYQNNLQAAQGFDMTTMAVNDLAAAQQTWTDLGAGSIGAQTEEMGQLTTATQDTTAATEEYLAVRQKMAEENEKAAAAQEEWWSDFDTIAEQERKADEDRIERRRRQRAEFKEMMQESLAEQQRAEMMNTRLAGAEIMRNQGIVASITEVKAAYADLAAAREEELFSLMTSISGMDNPLDQWNASSGASPFSQVALDATNAAESLDNLFRVVVGNTDAIANQAQGVADWADELIGVEGVVGEIDTAYQRWIASGMEVTEAQLLYNDAQSAATSIFASNAAIQEHIQDIQIAQAPLIAESTAALERQMGAIADMPAQQQLVALAWMDSATAAKALEIATMATAVANGELGASGEAAFTSYLQGIAAVDPAMKALLIDMGLIEEGADGTITVNMDGAEGAISDIDRLTSAIVALLDFLDDGEINGSVSIEGVDNATPVMESVSGALSNLDGAKATVTANANDPASGVIRGVQNILDNLDGDTATVNILANNLASGAIAAARAALDALNGRTATAYVNTVYSGRTVGPTQLQGGVPGFEQGGVTFYGGEGNRPELARFANGGVGVVPNEGFWSVPPATRIVPNNGNTYGGGMTINAPLTINAPIYGVDDLDERFALHTQQMADALERNRLAAGVY